MDGKESILKSIADSGEKAAAAIIREAEKERGETIASLKLRLEKEYIEAISAADAEAKEIVKRRKGTAELEKGKLVLRKKQELIDRVYEEAVTKTLNMTDNLYREFVAEKIMKYADKFDIVSICARDEKRLNSEWLDALNKKLGLSLTLSDDRHDFKGGVILYGAKCDKNLTVESEAKRLKEETSFKVNKKLFQDA